MIDPICAALTVRGYTVGRYIGSDKSGLEHFLDGTTDLLVGSSPLGTGLDGLQTVCRTMIFLSLPWTSAEFEQIIGRIQRQGSRFERVEIVIPQVLFFQQGETWSWDQLRMGVIEAKRALSDCILDGQLPQTFAMDKQVLLQTSQKALEQWIRRVRQGATEQDLVTVRND
jgi:hypothetical protein